MKIKKEDIILGAIGGGISMIGLKIISEIQNRRRYKRSLEELRENAKENVRKYNFFDL